MSKEPTSQSGGKKPTIKLADMPEDMQLEAQNITLQAIEKYTNERDIAYQIKREFERKYLGSWHCVVGKQYSSYVTHEEGPIINFAFQMLKNTKIQYQYQQNQQKIKQRKNRFSQK